MLNRAGNLLMACLVVLFVVATPFSTVHGYVSSCSASSSPNSVEPGPATFQITVTNTSAVTVGWMRITRPSANYVINSSNSPGWTVSSNQSSATLMYGSLDPGASTVINVNVSVGGQLGGPDYWTVDASDSDASDSTSCSGVLDASTSSSSSPPSIYNVSISQLLSTSITINWTTDKPASSQVNYGPDSGYGSSTDLDTSLVTDHSVNINGLSPGTAYHYQVLSDDGNNNATTSSDNTFVTPSSNPVTPPSEAGPAGSSSSSGSNNSNGSAKTLSNFGVPIKAVATEHTPPTISLNTNFTKPFKQAPPVDGNAADNEALAVIEYSTDGGANWLPVNTVQGIGGKTTSFSFTPVGLEDGNYSLLARAIDTSGNTGQTPAATLVIDRLDPLVGGTLLSQGPQMLTTNASGTIVSMAGIDQKITLSAVGGPTSIILTSHLRGGRNKAQTYSLTKSTDTGLWSGVISFLQPGQYDLTATAVDGAGNKTVRLLSRVDVASPAHTTSLKTHQPVISTVTLYYLEPESHSWVVWDGASYGQVNPQHTDKQGNFGLFLPPGKYYLKAQAADYETLMSSIFETNQSTPMTSNLALKPLRKIGIGPLKLSLPMFAVQKIDIAGDRTASRSNPNKDKTSQSGLNAALIGKPAPDFALTDTNGANIHTADLLGRPTLITFGSTWSPTTTEQLVILSQLQADKDINIVPIALQESSAKVVASTNIANLNLRWLVDPDSTLSNSYRVQSLPTHYFLDRKGTVQHVLAGVLSKQQILDMLSSY